MGEDKLELVRQAVARHMSAIQRYFKPDVKVTVVVRTPGNAARDLIMTGDEPDEVIEVLRRRGEAT